MGPALETFGAQQGSENRVATAAVRAAAAVFYAWAGQTEDALRVLTSVMPAIERGSGNVGTSARKSCELQVSGAWCQGGQPGTRNLTPDT